MKKNILQIVIFIIIIFLHYRLFYLFGYPITIAALCLPLLYLYLYKWDRIKIKYLSFLLMILVWPIIVNIFSGHHVNIMEFMKTYGLYSVYVSILFLFIAQQPKNVNYVTPNILFLLLCIITFISASQYLSHLYFGTYNFYNIFGDRLMFKNTYVF